MMKNAAAKIAKKRRTTGSCKEGRGAFILKLFALRRLSISKSFFVDVHHPWCLALQFVANSSYSPTGRVRGRWTCLSGAATATNEASVYFVAADSTESRASTILPHANHVAMTVDLRKDMMDYAIEY